MQSQQVIARTKPIQSPGSSSGTSSPALGSRPASVVSSSSSSRPASQHSASSIATSTEGHGFPFFSISEAKDSEMGEQAQTRPRHELMRLRRTSLPAVPTMSFLSHSVPPARSISNGPYPASKRMSTVSIQSFDSLPEEPAESLEALTMLTSPLSASTSSLVSTEVHAYSRCTASRRPSPSYSIAEKPSFISLSSCSPKLEASTANHRLSLPVPVPSPKRPARGPSSSSNMKFRLQHPRKALKRSVTEPPPFSPEEAANRTANAEKRKRITSELVDTEKRYVDVLNEIEEHYLNPLTRQTSSSYPIIDRKGITEIFSNFTDIVVLAREVLRRLQFGVGTPRIPEESPTISRSESAKSQEGFPGLNAASGLRQSQLASPSSLSVPSAVSSGTPGTLLLPLCPFLKCYSLFVQNFSRSLARIDQEERTNPAWKRFANERKKAGHDRGLGLSGMLLAVVQRIPRYRLLLDDLLQRTEEDHLDYADLIRATQSVEQVANQLESSIREHDATQRLLELQKSFTNLDFALVSPGRKLLYDGPLTKVCRKNEQTRHFFLFSDMILYASIVEQSTGWTRAVSMTGLAAFSSSASLMNLAGLASSTSSLSSTPQYQYHRHLQLNDTTVVGTEGNYFEIRSSEKSFAVSAKTSKEKEAWLRAIRMAKDEMLKARTTLQTGTFKKWESRRTSLYADSQEIFSPAAASLALFPTSPDSLSPVSPTLPTRPALSSRQRRWSAAPSSYTAPVAVAENYNAPVWIPDHRVDKCGSCQNSFGVWKRKHHCRMCGNVFCWNCTSNTIVIPLLNKEDDRGRACNSCFAQLQPSEEPQEYTTAGLSSSNTPLEDRTNHPPRSPGRLALQAGLREKLRA